MSERDYVVVEVQFPRLRDQVKALTKESTSKIELRLLAALLAELSSRTSASVVVAAWPEHGAPTEFSFGSAATSNWQFRIDLQKHVGPYRTDLVVSREGVSIHVETDGHEFHEKTKEQAAHDKRRDRFYVYQGLLVLRFTGSEVFADAERCAREVLGLLSEKTKNGTENQ